jgi:hypothetical protein
MVVTPGPSLCEFTGASRLNQDVIAKRFGSGAICESMTWIRQDISKRTPGLFPHWRLLYANGRIWEPYESRGSRTVL